MNDHYVQSGTKLLRCGYTTGTCATLASLGAATLLLTGTAPSSVSVLTPKGWTVEVVPSFCERTPDGAARCGIVKDSGDDPDVTNGMTVIAEVSVTEAQAEAVVIDGGEGVGRVTKPGLDQPVGNAAINHVPREMIAAALTDLFEDLEYDPSLSGALSVVISIPGGEERAQKTFNPKLGIEGGLSVLGTSGIVEPMSEQALKDTIAVELRQAYALQQGEGVKVPSVILTPGNYGRDFLEEQGWTTLGIPVVKISNYLGDSIDAAVSIGFQDILLAGHIGKLVKVAGGIMNTHSKTADCRMEIFAAHAAALGGSPQLCNALLDCATTDAALELLKEAELDGSVMARIAEKVQKHLTRRAGIPNFGAVIFSNVYGLLAVTPPAEELLNKWRHQHE